MSLSHVLLVSSADHEEQVNRYEAMMSSSRDQSSQMKELQARCRELQAKVDSTTQAKRQERDNMDEAHRELESKVREHRRRAERAEHDRNRFEQDLKDTNEELRGLERKLKGGWKYLGKLLSKMLFGVEHFYFQAPESCGSFYYGSFDEIIIELGSWWLNSLTSWVKRLILQPLPVIYMMAIVNFHVELCVAVMLSILFRCVPEDLTDKKIIIDSNSGLLPIRQLAVTLTNGDQAL